MPTPLENAQKRLEQLRQETARVEQFIRDYREFASGTETDQTELTSSVIVSGSSGNVSTEKSTQAVDKWRPARRKVRPDEIAQMIDRVIREVGQPMTRGQLVDALERRDVELAAADKARYIGTIIWRHKSIFMNIDGRGYWIRGLPILSDKPQDHLFSDISKSE